MFLKKPKTKPIFGILMSILWKLKKIKIINGYKGTPGRHRHQNFMLQGSKIMIQ